MSEFSNKISNFLFNLQGYQWTASVFLDEVRKKNEKWAQDEGLISSKVALRHFLRIDCACFAAHTYPTSKIETISLGADLIAWLFLFDDYYGEARYISDFQRLESFFYSLCVVIAGNGDKHDLCGDPFAAAILNITNRGEELIGPAWRTRFLVSMKSYFDGCLAEHKYRKLAVVPSLSEYRIIREGSIGAYPVFDLIEAQNLPEQSTELYSIDFRHPLLIEARKLAALLCTWVNDFYSFEKETLEKDPNNLIYVIANEFHITMDEAVTKALEIHKFDYLNFCNLIKQGNDFDLEDREQEYLVGLRYWVDGGLHWTAQTRRYREYAGAMFSQSETAAIPQSQVMIDAPFLI